LLQLKEVKVMKRGISLFGGLLLAASGAAVGQQPGAQQQPAVDSDRDIAAADRPRTSGFVARMERGHISTEQLVGSNLVDAEGENIGDVEALLIDEQTGEVAAVLVSVGGLAGIGARTVALSWDGVQIVRTDDGGGVFGDRYEVRTQMSRDQLEDAPEFEGDFDDNQIDDL
jgi:sporulation protein YlmC with PRC-barrel domain